MKIAIFGANGHIGQRVVQEALKRGHQVTGVVRDPSKTTVVNPNFTAVSGDTTDIASIAAAAAGHDAVVSTIGPNHAIGNDHILLDTANNMVVALKQAGVKRLLIVGGAGSLEVAPGVRFYDTPEFPEAWRKGARVHGAALDMLRGETDLEWTFFSPAGVISPGQRTGVFRVGGDQLLTDAAGQSNISTEDYAVALLDELEHPAHIRARFTVAY